MARGARWHGPGRRGLPWRAVAAGLALLAFQAAGCAAPVRFPEAPLVARPTGGGLVEAYDTDADGQADYFTTQDASGRKVRIAYDVTHDGEPDAALDLDGVRAADCRHVVIILDGIGYDTVKGFRDEGRLRLFHPPSRVLSTFPAMTDLALGDAFQSVPCTGQEAVYFDHQANRLMGGDADYLSLKNEDWARMTTYRAATIVDPLAYLFPNHFLGQEFDEFRKRFDRRDETLHVAYFVSTAGIGTKELLEGQRKVLDQLDRLVEELVWKTRGLVKVTVFSDHGHTLVRGQWIDFRKFLREKGWNVRDRLDGPKDVVPIEYGLITYASYATRDPQGLAATLLEHEGVAVVTTLEGEAVAVASAGGKALIERRGDRYRYRAERGDPLGLEPVIEKAKAGPGDAVFDADGFAADRDWLRLTLTHTYPDALDRLWRAWHGQTEHVPDVIASLKEGYNAGLASRAMRFPEGASTHGDLGYKSSTALLMSTAGALPPVAALRMRDLPGVLPGLTGRPWPPPRKAGAN